MQGVEGADKRLLIVIPNWVGDVVLATPVLAALRRHFADTHVCYLMRRYVREVLAGAGWHDEEMYWPQRGDGGSSLGLVRQLRRQRFQRVLLLTNSFRSAVVTWLAGIPQRVGYARDGRSLFLTHRLKPLKRQGEFVPSSVLPYYARVAEHVGCPVPDRRLRLSVTVEEEARANTLREHYKLPPRGEYAVVNPGAAFGAAKCWPPERFAVLCDRITDELGWRPVLVGAPGETSLMRKIAETANRPVSCCDNPGTTLGSLKPLIRDAALLVCNDTGPRHYGNAFNIPTVTIFGPTHQAWTETDHAGENRLQIPVPCGPCQLRLCPLDHRCMTGIRVDLVMESIQDVLERHAATTRSAARPQQGTPRSPNGTSRV